MFEWLQQLISQFLEYLKPWTVIEEFEEGVLLSWGKFSKVLKPGTYFKWPIKDYCYTTIVKYDTIGVNEVSITTLDGKTISVGCIIEYEITDVRKFLLETNDAKSNIKDVCRGIISKELEDISWGDIKKKVTLNRIRKELTNKCQIMGVNVIDVMFTDKCETFPVKLFTDSSSSGKSDIISLQNIG